MIKTLKRWASKAKQYITALYLAYLHPDVSRLSKLFIILIVAYAVSPIDLIPDFIPILGLLDEVILLPIACYLTIKTLPVDVWQSCLLQAEQRKISLPAIRWMGWLIILFWIFIISGGIYFFLLA
ncbi:hypothetical protein LCGC14_0647190 [marine sediment metagenome]|uniref:DUF1232 domain-containing protein n=1 Tax=marine sediment metagenome TaxID=412755 RepID=A0A0F9QXD7_9ZZZZ